MSLPRGELRMKHGSRTGIFAGCLLLATLVLPTSTGVFAATSPPALATSAQSDTAQRQMDIREGVAAQLEYRLDGARGKFRSIAGGVRSLPKDVGAIYGAVENEIAVSGMRIAPLLLLFIALGLGAQWAVRRVLLQMQYQQDHLNSVGPVEDRSPLMGAKVMSSLLEICALAGASLGAFVIFDWPPMTRIIIVSLLLAFVGLRITQVAARLVLSGDRNAAFWSERALWFFGLIFFGLAIFELFVRFGAAPQTQDLLKALMGTLIAALAIETLWHAQRQRISARSTNQTIFLTAWVVVLWLFWLAGFKVAFLLASLLIGVPVIIGIVDRAVGSLWGSAGAGNAESSQSDLMRVIVQRTLRAVILIGTAFYLEATVRTEFPQSSAILHKITDIFLNAIIAIVLFDFVWCLVRTYIDKRIANFRQEGVPATEQAIRRHRFNTVLPILRNFLFIFLAALTALVYLSSIGIAVAPLIAGASVFGIALGFGSQTLVKDVLSGIFYLLDDAFRIGEYIQSGSYMGTVEGFTLRSIRLRHHRGPVFIVPFGSLGAIQNMSRDWVMEKIVLSVTYDSDLVKAKKLIKQVGQEILENPEFSPHILETLKMQGIDELGDFAVKIRLKLMARPGQQAAIRRWVLSRIKTLFEENGIEFAYPTVRVAEGRAAAAASMVPALPKTS